MSAREAEDRGYGPPVTRSVRGGTGSRISSVVPPLDQKWSELEKLRWHAAVVGHDHGYTPRVFEGAHGFCVENSSDRDFYDAWTYINGIARGIDISHKKPTHPDRTFDPAPQEATRG